MPITDFTATWVFPPRTQPGKTWYSVVYADAKGEISGQQMFYIYWLDLPEGITPTGPYWHAPSQASVSWGIGSHGLHLKISPDVKPGSYPIKIRCKGHDDAAEVIKEFTETLIVEPAPTGPLPKKTITEYPPIPLLDQFEEKFQSRYAARCDLARFPKMAIGWEPDDWYYDGARTRYQMAEYTKDPKWIECGDGISTWYAEQTLKPGFQMHGHRVFPHGLAMRYKRTGEPRMLDAIKQLALGSAFARVGGTIDSIRETAYIFQAYTQAKILIPDLEVPIDQTADYVIYMLDMFANGKPSLHTQPSPFMYGLLFEAAIQYYEYTLAQGKPDYRFPWAVQRAADRLWETKWVEKDQGFIYIDGQEEGETGYPDLNPLISPAYAWLWKETGDSKYQEQADKMFASAVERAWYDGGKQFNQIYRWTFDFIKWRSKPKETPNMEQTKTLKTGQSLNAKLSAKNAKTGKPAKIDGVPEWSIESGEDSVTLTPSEDGMRAKIVASDVAGDVTVLVEADTDRGEGVRTVAVRFKLLVEDRDADALAIELDEPTEGEEGTEPVEEPTK